METKDLEKQRNNIQAKIAKIDGMRQNVFAQEQERQKKIEAKNALETKKIRRESELATDTSGITDLLNEKAELEKAVAECSQNSANALSEKNQISNQISDKKSEIARLTRNRTDIIAEMKCAVEVDTGINAEPESDTCPLCEQKLPAKKIAEAKKKIEVNIALAEARKQKNIDDINERGNAVKESIGKVNQEIESLTSKLQAAQKAFSDAQGKLGVAESAKTKRFAEIDELIKNNPKPDPAKDPEWQQIVTDIAKLEAEIGEPTGDQITALDNRRTILNNDLAEVNKALADADNAKKAKTRIVELETQEKALAQQLADIERLLAMIGDYTQKKSELIESSVNGMFKHVKFKMFETCLNGNIEPACEATYNGVPYSGLSTGQQIFVGIDIINVLSKHYGISAPLFIDRAESFTMKNEAECQTIELHAKIGIKKLTITRKEVLANV